MDKLVKYILPEIENIKTALANLETALDRKETTIIELAAVATFLHNVYNGIENILKQILISKNIQVKRSSSWHKELLDISLSRGIISKKLSDELYEYMTFRHFFVHSYGFMLNEEKIRYLTDKIKTVWSQFQVAIDIFLKNLDNKK